MSNALDNSMKANFGITVNLILAEVTVDLSSWVNFNSLIATMVHKQYSLPHPFENTGDESLNNMPVEPTDVETDRETAVQNRAVVYPMENINQEAVRFSATWSAPRSSGFVPVVRGDVFPLHHPNIVSHSEDTFIHQSNVGTFKSVPESIDSHASSSSYVCHTLYDADGAFANSNIDVQTQHLKRKGPMIPSAYEAGSSSRYYFSGSSSNFPVTSEICREKPRNDNMQLPCNCFCPDDCYNCNGLEVRSEGSLRNVRSRTGVDPNYSDAGVPVPTNASHSSFYTSNAVEHCSMVSHQGQYSSALTSQWNNSVMSNAHGRALTPDPGIFRLQLGRAFVGSDSCPPFEAVNSDFISGRNSVAYHSSAPFEAVSTDVLSGRNSASRQRFHGPSNQPLRHSRSNYSQRSSRDFRHPSSAVHSGSMGGSEARLHSGHDGYQRHRRPVLGIGWHHGDRNRRSRICHERYRSFHDQEDGHHHQVYNEGFMAMDRSSFYAPRNAYDQHRDLRLDIDNMSYEDLLALGERIGSVSTGLSEDAIRKCLIEYLYYSYNRSQDDSRCVICLEDYENKGRMGRLKACGHDYHASCVRTWLSMKNLCPICKAPALEEEGEQ
ncbi:hypothetical protein MLD38_026600 [Melastoma candidum]|uniref:Uncharacterized protein n=1 Tax=Melastoma candidum TaxID=119954 RepID=A0ACB9P0N6_9MYRT|nr:hypothetical protein MLD38_026600 [Melastoma candidum]